MKNNKPAASSKLDLDYFETVILYNSLTNQEYLSSIIQYCDSRFFNDKKIAAVLGCVSSFFVERGALPSASEIKTRLSSEEDRKSLAEVKAKLSTVEGPFNREELIDNTEKFFKQRFIYNTIINVAEKYSESAFSIEDSLAEFEKAYNISLRENLGHWYFDDIDKHIQDLLAVYNPIPTGWKFFDERTEGGLFPKTLTVFAGQVNVGKSIVLGNISTNMLLANKNVLLISLEMSEFMYSKRISTQLTQIPHGDLKTYSGELKEQVLHLKRRLEGNLVIKEYPPKSVTVRQIDAYITKLKHKGFSPDIVVIDYVNLIHPLAKNLNSYESVKEICEHLRALAFKYCIPFVSATQLNRGAFNTASPGMEGISESIGLAATCDVICSLWQEEEDRELGVINIGFQKNRFGPNFGSAAFKCNYNTLTLKETNSDYFEADDDKEDVIGDSSTALNKLLEHE